MKTIRALAGLSLLLPVSVACGAEPGQDVLVEAEGAELPPALVFQEDFGPDAAERWIANSATLAVETGADEGDWPCLRIEDAGCNSQAFVRLAVNRGIGGG
jgi:hypothetical protein